MAMHVLRERASITTTVIPLLQAFQKKGDTWRSALYLIIASALLAVARCPASLRRQMQVPRQFNGRLDALH